MVWGWKGREGFACRKKSFLVIWFLCKVRWNISRLARHNALHANFTLFPYTAVLFTVARKTLPRTFPSSPGCLWFTSSLVFNFANLERKPKDSILRPNFRNRLPTSEEIEMQHGGATENSVGLVQSCIRWRAKQLKSWPWLLYQRLAKCCKQQHGKSWRGFLPTPCPFWCFSSWW